MNIRRVIADFGGVLRGADGFDFGQAQRAVQGDEAGIKMRSFEVNVSVGRNGLGILGVEDADNFIGVDEDTAVGDGIAGDSVNDGVL